MNVDKTCANSCNITLSFKFNGLIQETANDFVDNTESCTWLELASVAGGILHPCALFWQPRNPIRNKTCKVRGKIV